MLLFSFLITVAIETEPRKFFLNTVDIGMYFLRFCFYGINYLLYLIIFFIFLFCSSCVSDFCFCQHNLDSCCLTHSEFIACCSVLFSAYILFPFTSLRLLIMSCHTHNIHDSHYSLRICCTSTSFLGYTTVANESLAGDAKQGLN